MSDLIFDTLTAAAPTPSKSAVHVSSQYLTMRDNTSIAIDVLLPLNRGKTPFSTIMIMARYWRSMELRVPGRPNRAPQGPRDPIADDLLTRGFAVVVVDARGTGASTGVQRFPWSSEELADYAEVAAWITQQPWSDGYLGAVGISYEGSTAQYLLATGISGVRAVVPMEFEFDVYTDVALPGGIYNQAFIQQWNASNHLLDQNRPSKLFPFLARLLVKGVRPVDDDRATRARLRQALEEHQENTDVYGAMENITYRDDGFGSTGVTLDDFSVFRHQNAIEASGAAMMVWGSWLDGTTADTVLRAFNTFSNPQISIIGAWKHEMTAHASPFAANGAVVSPSQSAQWSAMSAFFASQMRDNAAPPKKMLYYFTLGEEKWKRTDVFPLPNTELQDWYFQEDNQLAPHLPTGNGEDRYTVDFNATTGKHNRWHTQMAQPVRYANRAAQDRHLLTYTSAPMREDTEITGYPTVTLSIESTEPDFALFVYLEDVDEDGVVRYVTEGQLRSIHHRLRGDPPPYWSGMPYRSFQRADSTAFPVNQLLTITIGLQPTSVLIRRGHRIRVAIAGADKDTFARIPAANVPEWTIRRLATQPSWIRLPVITPTKPA